MIEFLSGILPKLGWVVIGAIILLIGHTMLATRRRNLSDAEIKKNGVNVTAEIVSVAYDKLQRVNNHLTGVVTVKYTFHDNEIFSKRGLAFPYIEKDKFNPGCTVEIRVNRNTGSGFYFSGYENY